MLKRIWTLGALAVAFMAGAILPLRAADSASPSPDQMQYKWVYLSDNFMRAERVNEAIEVMKRAAKSGYNGIGIIDCKFSRWAENVTVHRPEYDNNLKRIRQACRDLKLQCYVFCCDQGPDMSAVDPNLAEGLP